MADTKVKSDLDTPAGYNGSNGPGSATKMPVKHYPSTTAMATRGKSNTLDGPCSDKKY